MQDHDLAKWIAGTLHPTAGGASNTLPPLPVTVAGGDYKYSGWVVGVAIKRNGVMRAVVEDDNGRLFIHRAEQLSLE